MPSRLFATTIALCLLMGTSAFAQQPPQPTPQPNATHPSPQSHQKLSQADQKFVKEAAMGGQFEVELGRLAQQNANDQRVKDFGARMVQDHGNANAMLTAIATGKGETMPQQLDAKHAQLRDRLAGLRGAEFDRAYISNMVKDHDEDARAFAKEAQNGRDEEIKLFAKETLAVVQDHDKLAHEIHASLTAVGSSRENRR